MAEKEFVVPVGDIGVDGAYFGYTELIRCKDCVYFEGKPNGYCSMWSDDYLTKYRTDDDYCSDAERKESS